VPKAVLEKALEQVPKSVKKLAPLVDYHIELMNAPDADDIEIVTSGETWESFKSHWVQYVSIYTVNATFFMVLNLTLSFSLKTRTCAFIPRKLRNKSPSQLSN